MPGHPPDINTIYILQGQAGTRGQVSSFELPNPAQPGTTNFYLATASHADLADRALTKISDGQAQGNQFLIEEGTEMLEDLEAIKQAPANFTNRRAH